MNSKISDSFGYWFSGFADGEGCFSLVVQTPRYIKMKYGIRIYPRFSIYLEARDIKILKYIKEHLFGYVGIGISRIKYNRCWIQIDKLERCKQLIELFDKYPLRTKKLKDYILWKKAIKLLEKTSRHSRLGRSKQEILQIMRIKDKMNLKTKESKWTYKTIKRYINSYCWSGEKNA